MGARNSSEMLSLIEGMTVTEPRVFGNVAVSGLVDSDASPYRRMLSMDLALDLGKLKVDETDNVPSLHFRTDEPILIRAGEAVLDGGKQDRVVRESMIVDGSKDVSVFCIEAGRWQHSKEQWIHTDVPVSLRGLILKNADQNQVWQHVAKMLNMWSVSSGTSALGELYRQLRGTFSMRAAKFGRWDNQVGMIVTVDERVRGVEIFGDVMSFGRDSVGILRDSYIPDAIQLREGNMPMSVIRQSIDRLKLELERGDRIVEIVKHENELVYASAI
ncbi:MAG: ARPP-1 family domain-containing protein [Candidatus Thorarchaeota archaeon]